MAPGHGLARARLAGVAAHKHQSVGPAEKATARRGRKLGAHVDHGHVVASRLLCRAHRGWVDRPDLESGRPVHAGRMPVGSAGVRPAPPRAASRPVSEPCPLGLWPGPGRAARRSWWSPSRCGVRRPGSDGAAPTRPGWSGTRCPRPTRAPAPAEPARPDAVLRVRAVEPDSTVFVTPCPPRPQEESLQDGALVSTVSRTRPMLGCGRWAVTRAAA